MNFLVLVERVSPGLALSTDDALVRVARQLVAQLLCQLPQSLHALVAHPGVEGNSSTDFKFGSPVMLTIANMGDVKVSEAPPGGF